MDNAVFMSSIQYVNLGLPIIPFCSFNHEGVEHSVTHNKMCRCMGKAPLIKWRDRSETKREEVTSWKKEFKAYNVGLPLGGKSGYIGIDIDGADGERLLKELRGDGELPETWEYTTGAGRRLLYTIPDGMETKKSVNTGDGVHQECSILADGQCTVLPPSIHKNGNRYAWKYGASPETRDCAMAPTWLLDLVRVEAPRAQKVKEQATKDLILNLEQSQAPNNAFVDSMFSTGNFEVDIPPEVDKSKTKPVKASKEDKNTTQSWKILQELPVEEGGRDNALTKFIGSLLADATLRAAGKDVIIFMAKKYNDEKLTPPLTEEEVLIKVETFWANEQAKAAEYAKLAKGEDIIAYSLVQVLRNKLEELHLNYIFDIGFARSYYHLDVPNNPETWQEDPGNTQLKNIIKDIVLKPPYSNPGWITVSRLEQVIELYQMEEMPKQQKCRGVFSEEDHSETLLSLLPVKGKLLNWHTGQIVPWTNEFLSQMNFPVDYDPEAKYPMWQKYLDDWLPDKQIQQLLQEFLGQGLLARPDKQHKFMILYGDGRNGKSMFLETIQRIIGRATYSTSPLGKLSERFGASAIYQKRFNICEELDAKYIKDTGKLKELVGGDAGQIEMKGKDSFDYVPVCSFIFATNNLPRIGDSSDGWARRQVVIPFEQKFEVNALVSSQMKQNIEAELSGIFNWLLEGLRTSEERGKYVIPDRVSEANRQAEREQNDVRNFCEMFLVTTTADDLKARYTKLKRGLSAKFIHTMYRAWYTYEIGTGNKAKELRAFKETLIRLFGPTIRGTACITRAKLTSGIQNIDFSYSSDMLEFISNIENTMISMQCDSDIYEEFKVLQKCCKDFEDCGRINPAIIP